MLRFLTNHTEFCVMFVIVLFAVRKLTGASVPAISYATIAWAGVIIWITEFPFWPLGETLSHLQLGVGSVVSFAVISGAALLLDRTGLVKQPEQPRRRIEY